LISWRVLPTLPGFGRFHGGGVALSILAPTAGLILVGTVVQGLLVSAHEQRRLLVIAAIGFVLNLVLNVALIVPYSYVGAAVATTATEVGLVLVSLREARLRLGVRWPVARLPAVVAATALLLAVTSLGFLVHPLAQLAIALAVYVPALLATRALGASDLRGVLRREATLPAPLAPSGPGP
jgi:O-antigen/teichoic acid export membrane protein